VIHVEGSVDPFRDIETIETELLLADIETCQKRADRARKIVKNGEKGSQDELEAAEALLKHMDAGQSARTCPLSKEQRAAVKNWFLLTDKPVVYAANINEDGLAGDDRAQKMVEKVREVAKKEGAQVLVISARVEEEIAQMDPAEKKAFLEEMGIGKSGLDRLVTLGYDLLGLISFLTAGPKEVRAWTIEKGTKAPGAAGKIHSDFERGFIRAEIVAFDDLAREGSMAACKEKGLVRSEGKEYVMKDGDVTLFRFNV
jgi:GTP-binding protein YchF